MISVYSMLVLLIIAVSLYLAVSKRFIATGAIVMGNVLAHLVSISSGTYDVVFNGQIVARRTLVQHELSLPGTVLSDPTIWSPVQFLSSMFLHSDLLHLISNVIPLLAFALPFEERIGARKFLAIYLGGGLLGSLAQLTQLWGAPTIMLGASGAVFAIIGGFAAKYPRLVVPLPLPLFVMMIFVRMRVIVAATVFGGLQILYLFTASAQDNTAYLAHLGGLMGGVLMSTILVGKPMEGRPVTREEHDARVGALAAELRAFAVSPQQRGWIVKMEANADVPELGNAWLQKFLAETRCPRCESPIHLVKGETLCAQGHRAKDLDAAA